MLEADDIALGAPASGARSTEMRYSECHPCINGCGGVESSSLPALTFATARDTRIKKFSTLLNSALRVSSTRPGDM